MTFQSFHIHNMLGTNKGKKLNQYGAYRKVIELFVMPGRHMIVCNSSLGRTGNYEDEAGQKEGREGREYVTGKPT